MIKKINSLGLKFGIWMEPEAVSEDSDLYREHPDWALAVPGRPPVRARNQLLLDFSRKEVVDYTFDAMCTVLDQGNIEYLKWDLNRSLSDCFSCGTMEQGRVQYDYVLGLYHLMERLISRYPELLLEGCSGGGRFDAGMLYYASQIWCSDNTDAIDRTVIQYGTSFGYPVSAVGAHVSAVPNHQNGRITPLDTRALTAMAGTFGYEFDPEKLTEEEKQKVRSQIREYKEYSPLILNGLYYRLTNPMKDEVAAWEFMAEDGSEVLMCAVMLEVHGNMNGICIQLKGLESGCMYQETYSKKEYASDALMEAGIPLAIETGEYHSYKMHFIRKEAIEDGYVEY